ncbi:unnamed protein product [Ranitomeya imitator]|uniref:Cyclin G1 n=1 Tax=Ranitomeya imitator TaxID=111125 RepID=A0ABN9KY74_9NEOB|nr:unnamed protein product [Ranitomeya imitator]
MPAVLPGDPPGFSRCRHYVPPVGAALKDGRRSSGTLPLFQVATDIGSPAFHRRRPRSRRSPEFSEHRLSRCRLQFRGINGRIQVRIMGASKSTEEERNVPLATDLIRISQYKFTVCDMIRMEKIVLEKLGWKVKTTTAHHLLQVYHSLVVENLSSERQKLFSMEHLEANLKACHCRLGFSKAKPSMLALSILAVEMQDQKLHELSEVIEGLQTYSKISGRELFCWKELVSKCLAEYSSSKCSKPNVQKLKWIVSGRTARQLKHSYYRIAHLPTIPESAS